MSAPARRHAEVVGDSGRGAFSSFPSCAAGRRHFATACSPAPWPRRPPSLPLSWALPAWTVQVPAVVTAPLPVSVADPGPCRGDRRRRGEACWASRAGDADGHRVGDRRPCRRRSAGTRVRTVAPRCLACRASNRGAVEPRRCRPGGRRRASTPNRAAADRHARRPGDVGLDPSAHPAPLARARVERGADSRRARPRNRAHPAPRLAGADRRRSDPRDLLVQSRVLAGLSPPAARKRAGVRRRGVAPGRAAARLRHASAGRRPELPLVIATRGRGHADGSSLNA